VNRKPGDVFTLGIAPFFRLAETFAVTGGSHLAQEGERPGHPFRWRSRDSGAPPTLLEIDTDGTWSTASLGLTYSAPLTTKDGKSKPPMDAGLLWEGVIGSSGALRVPARGGVRFWFRLYGKL
jgi:hypothetical protein